MTMSPTELTLRHLKKEGYVTVEVVEHWNGHVKIRQDLFGIIDVLAVGHGTTLAVQTTSVTNVSARLRKIAESPHIGDLREAGWEIRCHGWKKEKNRWELKRDVDVS